MTQEKQFDQIMAEINTEREVTSAQREEEYQQYLQEVSKAGFDNTTDYENWVTQRAFNTAIGIILLCAVAVIAWAVR